MSSICIINILRIWRLVLLGLVPFCHLTPRAIQGLGAFRSPFAFDYLALDEMGPYVSFYSRFPQFLLRNGYYFHADKLVNYLELIYDYTVFLISFFLLEVCLIGCINSISLSLFCG